MLSTTAMSRAAIDPLQPATLFAGATRYCYRGVLRTSDGAGEWHPFGNPFVTGAVKTLAINPLAPSHVYAGTAGGGVYISHTYTSSAYWPLILRTN